MRWSDSENAAIKIAIYIRTGSRNLAPSAPNPTSAAEWRRLLDVERAELTKAIGTRHVNIPICVRET